jgi:hypothetical protein
MPRDFFDSTPEQQNVVLIDAAILRKAERLIKSCEACNEDDTQIPFDNILDRVTGSDPSVTDYILETPAKCAGCRPRNSRKYTDRADVITEPVGAGIKPQNVVGSGTLRVRNDYAVVISA